MRTIKPWVIGLALLCVGHSVKANDSFIVEDIRLEGLQRVALGAALTNIPFSVGDRVTPFALSRTIKSLYASGHFDHIKVLRDDNIVIFRLTERPTISGIEFDGNKDIKDEQLQESLDENNIRVGEPLDKTVLTSIENGLTDFFHSVGKYNAEVEIITTYLPRNRVRLKVEFEEGDPASIRQINIVGNEIFNDETLLQDLESQQNLPWWKFLSSDRYQKQALQGDIESIRSHYLDRGYLRFDITSNQVSVSPNKESVYVTLNLHEGETYTVSGFDFIGDLLDREEIIRTFVPIRSGNLYNGALTTHTEELIARYLGQFGYANTEVKTIPEVDEEKKEVKLIFSVNPGMRVYVRRISFGGNEVTSDEVLRRELRQLEGAFLSKDLLELSKGRIQRLTYMENVDYEIINLPGVEDQVDINFSVKEQPSGSFNAGVSYGSFTKLAFNLGVQQNNFLGTGNVVGFSVNTFSGSQNYQVSYTDPYFTIDGVSLGGFLSYNKFDADGSLGLERFRDESYGIGATLGFPINEYNRVTLGGAIRQRTVSDIQDYEQIRSFKSIFEDPLNPDNSLDFTTYELSIGWQHNTLNRGTFPTAGKQQSASLKVTTPNSDVNFFKLRYNGKFYFPLTNDQRWSFATKFEAGYGNGYGSERGVDHILPFWENFRSGGSNLRGFENNIVGPRAVFRSPTFIDGLPDENGNPTRIGAGRDNDVINVSRFSTGGNAIAITGAELIFPTPFVPEEFGRQVRSSLFVDVGNIWDTEFRLEQFNPGQINGVEGLEDFSDPARIRAAAGLSIQWLSPMGPLSFSFAKTLTQQEGDRTEFFSFNIGTSF